MAFVPDRTDGCIDTGNQALRVNVVAGGAGGNNPAAGATGSPVPAQADYTAFKDGSGNLIGVSAANPLPITGSISASNPSVGTAGAAAPASATEIGSIDGSGNLQGASVISELNARYYLNAYAGNMFAAMNTAAQAVALTGQTTYTGLIVYNPGGSGKNLALLEAIFAPTIVAAGVYAMLLFSQPIALAPPALTAGNSALISTNLNSGASSVAKVAASCTLAANPVFLRPLYGFGWITAVAQNAIGLKDELAGGIIVPPGSAVGFVALTTAITGLAYLSWAELPL
jgi:hypothetical protein